ncbi:MAG: YcjF family protein [Shimia sp.]
MSEPRKTGPVLIDLDPPSPEAPRDTPAEAPPVPEATAEPTPRGQAMQTAAVLAARRTSRLAKWFWSLLLAVIGFFASVAAWNVVTGLIAANPILGWAAATLVGAFVLVMVAIAIKELAALSRLSRIDTLHVESERALAENDLGVARDVVGGLRRLYAGRPDTEWGRGRLAEREAEVFDAEGLLALAEREVLTPLDALAVKEVEAGARQVATVTALVPLALADVAAALTSNLRMIRRIAEIYGGRSGTLGSWRLAQAVFSHLVATGAVAVGDDLIGSVAGGSLLAKVSRRFGEGIVNGALTARVGVAAMEVCRPLPFRARARPSVTGILGRAVTGLFDKE